MYTRHERGDKVAFVDGEHILRVPSLESLRERLITLLESVGGDFYDPIVGAFWRDRAKEIGNDDPMQAAFAAEIFERLCTVWVELGAPDSPEIPKEEEEIDIFADFGL